MTHIFDSPVERYVAIVGEEEQLIRLGLLEHSTHNLKRALIMHSMYKSIP